MRDAIVDKVARICDESRQANGGTTFWFTQDHISGDDLLQVSADLGPYREYGFTIKVHDDKWQLCFCARRWEKRFFGLVNPHVMKSQYLSSLLIDKERITDADIREWFDFVEHRFKKKFRPRLLKAT